MSTASQDATDGGERGGGVEDNKTLVVGCSVGSRFGGINDVTDVGLGGRLAIFDEGLEGGGIGGSWVVNGKAPTGRTRVWHRRQFVNQNQEVGWVIIRQPTKVRILLVCTLFLGPQDSQ